MLWMEGCWDGIKLKMCEHFVMLCNQIICGCIPFNNNNNKA